MNARVFTNQSKELNMYNKKENYDKKLKVKPIENLVTINLMTTVKSRVPS